MAKLIIIAGCNGAGKSTFASSFLPQNLNSFDYDRRFLEHLNTLPDSELRHEMALNTTTLDFEKSVAHAIENKYDFCYETNFDAHPIYWAQKFKENGYELNLIFFCIENQEIARHRIQVRTEFKGHFVDDKTIDLKWKEGYKNLNLHYKFFDNVLFVDNSIQNQTYTNLLQIEQNQFTVMAETLPNYFIHRIPDLYNKFKSST